MGRSVRHLITLVEDLERKDIGFRSLNEGAIDTTNATTSCDTVQRAKRGVRHTVWILLGGWVEGGLRPE